MGVVSQPVLSDLLAPARNQPAASAFIGASSPTDREEQPFWSACRFKGAWAAENRATSFLRRSFRLKLSVESRHRSFERIDEPLYPPLATRESLANALCLLADSIGGGSGGRGALR